MRNNSNGITRLIVALAAVFLFLTVFAVCAYAAPVEANERVGAIKGEDVNLRSGPGTDTDIVMKLNTGDQVLVTGQKDDWYQVLFGYKIKGWVFSKYLVVVSPFKGIMKGNGVAVRKGPDTDFSLIKRLDRGDTVYIFDLYDGWYRVGDENQSIGWMRADYLSKGGISRSEDAETANDAVWDAPGDVEDNSSDNDKDSEKSGTLGSKIVYYAKNFLGVKYVWAGESPRGFDCSGFVLYVYRNFGYSLPHSSAAQGRLGKKLSIKELRQGDLVFFDTNGGRNNISHVGIYIGNNRFIHASSGRQARKVVISVLSGSYYDKYYMTARRIIPD